MPPSFSVSGMLPNSHGLGGPAEQARMQIIWGVSIGTHASPALACIGLRLRVWKVKDPQMFRDQDSASRHLLQEDDTWEVTELEAMNWSEPIDNHLHDDGRIGISSMLGIQ